MELVLLTALGVGGATVMGAGIGKMICPQSIAIGAAAASLAKSEGVILRKAFVWCLVNVVLATVSVLVFTFR